MTQTDTPAERIRGSVERVTFHNPDNGYAVLKARVRGMKDIATIIGHVSTVTPGEFVEAIGRWTQHRDHGLQFVADRMRTIPPTTPEGMAKYLGSGMVKGIGHVLADRLVKAFGTRIFEVIDDEPESLRQVEGIGPARLKRITRGWADQKIIREIMLFLHSHGVSSARAVRIFKTYGETAIEVVSENPYRLAKDITGIGFKTADQIAQKLGIAPDSMIRARAGINHVLLEQIYEGHCLFPREELLSKAEELLAIPVGILAEALAFEVADEQLVAIDHEGVTLMAPIAFERAEAGVARRLVDLALGETPWQIDAEEPLIRSVEERAGFTLAASQRDAVKMVLRSKVAVITGGPGVGKSTIVRTILDSLHDLGVKVLLCAPTGRAAKRLTETTGREAKTIHRMLGFDPATMGFQHGEEKPLAADLVVIDEASMVDVVLMHGLLKAVAPGSALLIVGDVDQLPSVGPGQVLRDVIDSGVIPTARLTEVFRQAASSRIVVNAHRVNQGQLPERSLRSDGPSDFYFIEENEPERIVETVVELVRRRLPGHYGIDAVQDIQVLTPMNRGALGARALNLALQQALNGVAEPSVERFGWRFAPGDKVMVTANDYDKEVFNGDIGVVRAVDLEEQELTVDFGDREVAFEFGELDLLSLSYACSIHRSQGSEYPVVVMPLAMQHYMMLRRNLVYTGITRGKKLVVVVGQVKAMGMAVRNADAGRRWTLLKGRLVADAASAL